MMGFGAAIQELRNGHAVQRAGWIVQSLAATSRESIMVLSGISDRPYTASQEDMAALDWGFSNPGPRLAPEGIIGSTADPDGGLMDFGDAFELAHHGAMIRRAAWWAGDFVFLVPGSSFAVNRAPLLGIYPKGKVVRCLPHLGIDRSGVVSPWTPSHLDLLSVDWVEVPPIQYRK